MSDDEDNSIHNYNLRDNPKKTPKGREQGTVSRKTRENTKRELSENEITDDETTVNVIGTEQEQLTREDDNVDTIVEFENCEKGDFVGNPNSDENRSRNVSPTKQLETDQGDIILQMLFQLTEQSKSQSKQIADQSRELTSKLETQANTVNLKLEAQTQTLNQIREEINTVKLEIETDMKARFAENNAKLIEIIEQKTADWRVTLRNNNEEIGSTCREETKQLCDILKRDLDQDLSQTKSNVKQNQVKITNLQNTFNDKFVQLEETVTNQQNQIEQHDTHIREIHENQITLENTVRQLELTRTGESNLSNLKEIHITCSGADNYNPVPKFNGRERNPLEFLRKFIKFQQKQAQRQSNRNETFADSLDVCLEDSAARWWQVVKADINSVEEFERVFTNKYWNRDIQRGIKRRIEIEKYWDGGRYSRAEHFLERVITLRNLTPPMEESEIVNLLSDHYEQHIQDARRVQNVRTISEFEELLGREDVEERNNKIKNRTFANKTSYRERNYQNERPARNFNAPRFREPFHRNQRSEDDRNKHNNDTYPQRPVKQPQNSQYNRNSNSNTSGNHWHNPSRFKPLADKHDYTTNNPDNTCQMIHTNITRTADQLTTVNETLQTKHQDDS